MSAAAFLGVRTGTFNRQIVGLSWGVTLLVFLLYFIPFTSDHKAFGVPQTNIRSHHSSDYDTINAVSDGSTGKLRWHWLVCAMGSDWLTFPSRWRMSRVILVNELPFTAIPKSTSQVQSTGQSTSKVASGWCNFISNMFLPGFVEIDNTFGTSSICGEDLPRRRLLFPRQYASPCTPYTVHPVSGEGNSVQHCVSYREIFRGDVW